MRPEEIPGSEADSFWQVRGGELHGDVLHTSKLRLRLLRSIIMHLRAGFQQLQGTSQAAAWLLQTRASQAKVATPASPCLRLCQAACSCTGW